MKISAKDLCIPLLKVLAREADFTQKEVYHNEIYEKVYAAKGIDPKDYQKQGIDRTRRWVQSA